ncbi:MAG: hypothetical protein K2G02_02260, partial [Phocaeicola sp.]|nr:hypothetical protein [Phocaeicola sp.]
LEGFLTVFLDQKVTIVEILESEGGQKRKDGEFNRVDIKAKNSKSEIIIVEIQNMRILHREKLRYYSMSDAERHAYDEYINAVMIQNDVLGTAKLEGLMEGMTQGRAEGIANEKYNTARKMLSLNIPIETIMEVTGLSEDEIS